MDEHVDQEHVGVNFEQAFGGGFLGVAAMTMLTQFATLFPDLATLRDGSLLTVAMVGELIHRDPNAHLILGGLAHLLVGVLLLPWVYARMYTSIPGGGPMTRGLVFAGGLFLIGRVIAVVVSPTALDPFSLVGGIVIHAIYGIILATVYGHHIPSRAGRLATAR